MKTTIIIFLFICASINTMAQTSVSETTTLAIKYLEGQAGNYPNSSFVSGITAEDDDRDIWGIKPSALYEGCRGEVRVTNKDGYKTVVLVKEFSSLDDAEQDMNQMIAATKKFFPSLQTQVNTVASDPNRVEQKIYSDESRGIFLRYG